VAAGGVGTIPWRLGAVETALAGKPANAQTFALAVADAGLGAITHSQNQFKVPLLQQTIIRALQTAAALA
jgi:xanthine dehydrogenase YagS FAD-binding subunit